MNWLIEVRSVEYQTMERASMQLGIRHIPHQVLKCYRSCLLLNFIRFHWSANLSTWQNMWLPMISKFCTSSVKTPGREWPQAFPRAKWKCPTRSVLEVLDLQYMLTTQPYVVSSLNGIANYTLCLLFREKNLKKRIPLELGTNSNSDWT